MLPEWAYTRQTVNRLEINGVLSNRQSESDDDIEHQSVHWVVETTAEQESTEGQAIYLYLQYMSEVVHKH